MIRKLEDLYKGIDYCYSIRRGGRFCQILLIPPMITQIHPITNKIKFQWCSVHRTLRPSCVRSEVVENLKYLPISCHNTAMALQWVTADYTGTVV